jgi:hypothetical protein
MAMTVLDYHTVSQVPGLGKTVLSLDKDRTVQPSYITATALDAAGAPRALTESLVLGPFPAVQTMNLNILITTEALGDTVLRTRGTAALVNSWANSFPPTPGDTYVLRSPIELEDIEKPGETVGRLESVSTTITSSRAVYSESALHTGAVGGTVAFCAIAIVALVARRRRH